ncbi:MAG TPA: beta-ketoacyl-ACP synthase 3 [Actinospica sp.]|nr:beta-ketoacyl-ACP synthase 3 [Actinospica sp.]
MTTALKQPVLSHTGMGLPVPFGLTGTGMYLPPDVITNERLAQTLETSDEWIVARTGICERRRLAPELATSDMCVAAAYPALATAGLDPEDLDAIIVATYTWDQPLPSTALIVKNALGSRRAITLDVTQAACANGIQAVMLAAHLLQNPSVSNILVLAADCASRVTAPDDRTTRVFFGDAAAAAVFSRNETAGAGLLSYDLGSRLSYDVEIPGGGSRLPTSPRSAADGRQYLKMDGRAVWRTATEQLPRSISNAALRAGLTVDQIDHLFLHQANLNLINQALTDLDVPHARAPITVDRIGNTGSAGAFTALHQGYAKGDIRPGDTYVLTAIGAGFQWGTVCLRHA